MFKVEIKRNSILTNVAKFEIQSDAIAWLEKESLKGSFGKLQRDIYPIYGEYQEDISNSISQRTEVTANGDEVIVYTLPQEFVSEIIDITSEELLARESADALSFLQNSDYKVLRHIRQQALNIETTLTQQEYLALEQQRHDASLKVI